MSNIPSPAELAEDARWLAQATNPAGTILRLIEMTPETYRSASFLDDRLFQTPVNAQSLAFDQVAAALSDDARTDARWIFHIGHVGSTLVSRLLGELDGVLAIREPRLLRDLAAIDAARRSQLMQTVQKLFSRTFAPNQSTLIKATSFVGEIADEVVPAGARALFVYADARTYIATILAGENSLKELIALAPARALRMAERVPGLRVESGSLADLAAAAWACEITALESAAASIGDAGVRWVNFDALLDDVPAALAKLSDFLGFHPPPGQIRAIAQGPLLSRYSKALEYEYSPSLRCELIEQEQRINGRQIDAALAMLNDAAQKSPLLARALARGHSET
jgi:hypothetical protein